MTWRTSDGRTYREADRPSSGIQRTIIETAPQAPETRVEPPVTPESPIDPVQTARERLSAVLDRIKSGELGAVSELPGALANARKES